MFPEERSAQLLSHQVCTSLLHRLCLDGMETAPPQNSASGLLMCLSPQVHSLMWRDWFLNGCFSSQRNTCFQSLIRELLGFTRRHVSPLGFRQVQALQQMRISVLQSFTVRCIRYYVNVLQALMPLVKWHTQNFWLMIVCFIYLFIFVWCH